jgi:hypothetical protein
LFSPFNKLSKSHILIELIYRECKLIDSLNSVNFQVYQGHGFFLNNLINLRFESFTNLIQLIDLLQKCLGLINLSIFPGLKCDFGHLQKLYFSHNVRNVCLALLDLVLQMDQFGLGLVDLNDAL